MVVVPFPSPIPRPHPAPARGSSEAAASCPRGAHEPSAHTHPAPPGRCQSWWPLRERILGASLFPGRTSVTEARLARARQLQPGQPSAPSREQRAAFLPWTPRGGTRGGEGGHSSVQNWASSGQSRPLRTLPASEQRPGSCLGPHGLTPRLGAGGRPRAGVGAPGFSPRLPVYGRCASGGSNPSSRSKATHAVQPGAQGCTRTPLRPPRAPASQSTGLCCVATDARTDVSCSCAEAHHACLYVCHT